MAVPHLGFASHQLASQRLRQPILQFAVRILRSLSLRLQRLPRTLEDKGAESRGYVLHRGYRLPPKSLRGNMCGDAFRTDSFYFLSAVLEATKFPDRLGYTKDSRIVDIGSGLGRIATGILSEFGNAHYLGIDANRDFVRWCQENIESEHPTFRFVHLDMANDMYNPQGTISGSELRLPVADASTDIAYLWGVFTNMVPRDVESYIGEIARILRPQGRCFLTACVEDDVPDVTLNPPGYVPYECKETLGCVRYSRQWLFSALRQRGLQVGDFRHHGSMFPKQSEIYLVKTDSPLAPR
jgi:ubiquinone/menaquinone biosynthesis C-methylase UbiE